VELQGRLDELQRKGLGLAVLSYDSVAVLADFAGRRGIDYPLLSDEGSVVIRRYGLLNTTIDPGNQNFGYPFPGTFMLDTRRTVTSRFFEDAYQERNTVASIFVRLGDELNNIPGTRVSSPYLDITSYATDQVVAPGTRLSLVLDLEPGEDIHVYAPGVAGYRPIALNIDEQPGILIRSAHYPESEEYFFEPLNERVPVYQTPFRIVQDITVDASSEGQAALEGATSLTITGTLNYQACDDKICYNPQSVPLSWTVALRSLDRERARSR
jgi:hypothetical protein